MTLYTAAITLILVMDPLGNIPIFLSILRKYESRRQILIILRETLVAFLVLCLFLFFGQLIMDGLHITTAALSIAGGIILFLIALRMIFPNSSVNLEKDSDEEPFIVPLAIPLIAGPSTLATVMLFVGRDSQHIWLYFTAIVIATAIFLVIVLSSQPLMRLLGKRGLLAIERLMGMILTTVAVQMFLTGLMQFIGKPLQ